MNSTQSGPHFPVQHQSLSLDIKVPVLMQKVLNFVAFSQIKRIWLI
jgi:hypothetical protein